MEIQNPSAHAVPAELLKLVPKGCQRVKFRIQCNGCARAWERTIRMTDRFAPDAFEEIVRSGRAHERLYAHGDLIATMDPNP